MNDNPNNLPATTDPADLAKRTGIRTLDRFFRGLADSTVRAYRRDLCDFAKWLDASERCDFPAVRDGIPAGEETRNAIVGRLHQWLFALEGREANLHVEDYVELLMDDGYAPATANRRLAAIKSLAKLGRKLGAIYWTLEIDAKKVTPYRDTSGPTFEEYRKMLDVVTPPESPKELRDHVLLRLAYVLALRRNECVTLDCKHVDTDKGRVSLLRKGKKQRERKSVPERMASWLAKLVEQVGGEGPLFRSYDTIGNAKGERITGDGVYYLVHKIAERAGIGKVTPHGLRHAAITHCLDRTGGNIRKAQALSGHVKPETLFIYDDNRRDLSGQASELLDASLELEDA